MVIYFDNNATTALDAKAREAIIQELDMGASNPSSVHALGRKSRARLLSARDNIASFFKVKPSEIIFSSGGTEGINMLLKGLNLKDLHIITSDAEHSAVMNTLKSLNADITYLPSGLWGAVRLEQIEAAVKPNTGLITLMAANNETGVKTDLQSIASFAKQKGIPFIVDGVGILGKEPLEIYAGISAICFSAHKFHGPKGVGFTIIRKGLKIHPLITGGMQEYEMRSGTENLPGIMGMSAAISALKEDHSPYLKSLRDHFESSLLKAIPNISINGQGPRISNTSNLVFHGIDGETLLMHLDLLGICASHGSACSSGALEPSRVLLSMGLSKDEARSSLRFSFCRTNTIEEIDQAVQIIKNLIIK